MQPSQRMLNWNQFEIPIGSRPPQLLFPIEQILVMQMFAAVGVLLVVVEASVVEAVVDALPEAVVEVNDLLHQFLVEV